MRRRQFLGFTGAAFASLAPMAFAQASNRPLIGWLWSGRSTNNPNEMKGFQQGLRDLGYVEGQSIFVEYRFGEGSEEGLKDLAAELVRARVDVLVAIGTPSVLALRDTGTTIPIVAVTDLVARHLVESIPHPGGTITGIDFMVKNLTGKRLQLLKEAIPTLTQVGFLYSPKFSVEDLDDAKHAAPTLRLVLHSIPVLLIEEAKPAIARLKRDGVEAILVDPAPPVLIAYQKEIVDLALEFQIPTVSEQPEFAEGGGLLSYGPSIFAVAQRQAHYVDQILKGKKAADLPVEYPTKFELVINLKTAKRLGFAVPESLLVQADKVIE
jgi:putative ABC transport system substrate-binding protein